MEGHTSYLSETSTEECKMRRRIDRGWNWVKYSLVGYNRKFLEEDPSKKIKGSTNSVKSTDSGRVIVILSLSQTGISLSSHDRTTPNTSIWVLIHEEDYGPWVHELFASDDYKNKSKNNNVSR